VCRCRTPGTPGRRTAARAVLASSRPAEPLKPRREEPSAGAMLDKAVVDLRGQKLSASTKQQLISDLATNTICTELNLNGTGFSDEEGVALAGALTKNTTLKTLYVGGNQLGDAAGVAMANMLAKNATLTELDVSCNNISAKVVKRIKVEVKANNQPAAQAAKAEKITAAAAAAAAAAPTARARAAPRPRPPSWPAAGIPAQPLARGAAPLSVAPITTIAAATTTNIRSLPPPPSSPPSPPLPPPFSPHCHRISSVAPPASTLLGPPWWKS